MFRILWILLTVLALTACGPARIDSQQPLPSPSADWTSVKFTQSGGFMGMLRALQISRDGAWTLTDERVNETWSGKLSAKELDQLNGLVASLSVKSSGESGVCADCFIYTVEIVSSGATLTAQADDVNLADSGLGPLVAFLTNVVEQAVQ